MTDTDKPTKSTRAARAAEKAAELHTVGSDGVHPMAKILFGWTEWKHIGSFFFWGLAALGLVLVAIDVGMSRHDYLKFANATGFYAIYGFLAFSFVVLMGWPLGRLLRRGVNYYGDHSGPPDDIDPELDIPASDLNDDYEGQH